MDNIWERCPVCKGTGENIYITPQYSNQCNTCAGEGLISRLTGQPRSRNTTTNNTILSTLTSLLTHTGLTNQVIEVMFKDEKTDFEILANKVIRKIQLAVEEERRILKSKGTKFNFNKETILKIVKDT